VCGRTARLKRGWLLDSPYRQEILATLQRHVVARALSPGGNAETLLSALDQLSEWSNRLYEGAAISAAIGLEPSDGTEGDLRLDQICLEDFSSVMSNGVDTMMCFDWDAAFRHHECLSPPQPGPSFAPNRHGALAAWASDGRVALALNRLGEILAFRDGRLVFARRSGRWHFLTHETVVKQMSGPKDETLRKAVYESLLDASFSRTGACVGLVLHDAGHTWRDLVDQGDRIRAGNTVKTRALAKSINGQRFSELDRRLRAELLAIDGATVLSHLGEVLAVGAILKIPGGSTGGGRLAAARALSTYGIGIKVSQDGGIQGFDSKPEARFAVL
jgi:hypothetical protein